MCALCRGREGRQARGMGEKLLRQGPHVLVGLVLAGVSVAAWAGWLGWDQERDVHPDGSTTGPYEVGQVVGLVVSLLVPVVWGLVRRYFVGVVAGVTGGLTVAASYDWSDDASGLYGVGVGMVMLGSLAVTSVLSAVVASLKKWDGLPHRV